MRTSRSVPKWGLPDTRMLCTKHEICGHEPMKQQPCGRRVDPGLGGVKGGDPGKKDRAQ